MMFVSIIWLSGTPPENNIWDDTDRPDDSYKANKSAASVHWPNTKYVMKLGYNKTT